MAATKDMERKTLEKIKQMVEELGADSYLKAAFDGVYEIAEQNIENDWGCTTREYVEASFKVEEKARKEREEIAKQIENLKRELETKAQNEIAELEKKHREEIQRQKAERLGLENVISNHKANIHDREMTIMELKAKLYDYMAREVK